MAESTGIGWTDSTVNFWIGCKKVSEGCKFCYMFRDMQRWNLDPKLIHRTKPGTFNAALSWKEPRKIFTCSWSDFFIEEADEFRPDAWDIIRRTPQHSWQILTKRPERIMECLPPDWGEGWDNVWIGVSVENQQRADERLPIFKSIPAKTKFISAEPLLSALDLSGWLYGTEANPAAADWVIVGGESGNETGPWKYRPCDLHWIDKILEQCDIAGVPVFMKQLGTSLAKRYDLSDRTGSDMEELMAKEIFDPSQKLQQFPFKRYKAGMHMDDARFIAWAKQYMNRITTDLTTVRIPEPARPLPMTPGDMDLEFAMMDVPGVIRQRSAVFEWNDRLKAWIFQRIDRI